jgi:uncharacterized protein (DUF934 family)
MLRFLIATLLAVAATAAVAQTTHSGTFDVRLAGVPAGVVSFSAVEDGRQYSAAALVESSGLAALVREVSYDARATGRITARGFVPERYQESANTGERVSRAVMEFLRGVPQVKSYDPPREPRSRDVDPATQGGTLDPMTALFALLRDVPRAEVCTLDVPVFDGRRASRVTTSGPKAEGGRIVCEGEYRRVAGFSDRQMREKTRFPFSIIYAPAGDRYRVERIAIDTLYGRAVLDRR